MLERIRYPAYKWFVCADLKVVAILVGLQLGYTKYCCFCAYGTQELVVNITPESSGLLDWCHSLVSTTLPICHWFHKRKLYFLHYK